MINKDTLFQAKLKKVPKQEQSSLREAKNKVMKAALEHYDVKDSSTIHRDTLRDYLVISCIKNKDFQPLFTLMKIYPVENMKNLYLQEYKGECWLDDWSEHLLPYFAQILSSIEKSKQDHAMRKDADTSALKQNNRYCALWRNGVHNDDGPDASHLFFTQTRQDVYRALPYGSGNCGLMADFAFLNAIMQNLELDVTYVRFESPVYEEINAIALGNFPDAGSLIINPWLNQSFSWHGTTADTNEISSYPEYRIIFKSAPGEERARFLADLKDTHFLARFLKEINSNDESKDIINNRAKRLTEINTLYEKFKNDGSYCKTVANGKAVRV